MSDKKRNRGRWFLVVKSQQEVEEYTSVRDLRKRLAELDEDKIVLIKGRRHSFKKQVVEEVAIV